MEVKRGYKVTEVGVIPEEWEVTTASNACLKIQDGTHFSPNPGGGEFFYITSRNIGHGALDLSTATMIDRAQHRRIYARCDVQRGDLLLTKDGANTGNAAINRLNEQFSLLSSVAFLRFHPNRYSAQYFLQQILCPLGQKQIGDAMAGNAITRLTLGKIKNLRFPVPPTREEQETIAETLVSPDRLIESLEQLIAKKRRIKVGVLLRLITGKTRLEGFEKARAFKWSEAGRIPEDWDCDYIENLANVSTGGKNTQDRVDDGRFPFFVRSQKVERIDSYSYDGQAVLTAGDGVGTGKVYHYVNGRFDVHQRVYCIRDFSDRIEGYFFYLYFSAHFYSRIMQMTAKSSVDSVRREMITRMAIPVPPERSEQLAISSVLSDMDAEIEALEAKLAKAKQIKQGMMEELLTGRIRLA